MTGSTTHRRALRLIREEAGDAPNSKADLDRLADALARLLLSAWERQLAAESGLEHSEVAGDQQAPVGTEVRDVAARSSLISMVSMHRSITTKLLSTVPTCSTQRCVSRPSMVQHPGIGRFRRLGG